MNDWTKQRHGLTISHDGRVHQVPTTEDWVFGRQGDLIIDAHNRAMHRRMGRLEHSLGFWRLENCGRSITLIIADQQTPSYSRLVPGCSMPLPYAKATITFSAGHASYRINLVQHCQTIEQPVRKEGSIDVSADEKTLTVDQIKFNDEQKALLTLLAAPRQLGPITSADLASNRELADKLGWSMPKLVRKLDHVCQKLHRAGVSGLVPIAGCTASQRRIILADLVVENGLLGSSPVSTL